jgi:hypothetical protein
MMNRVVNYFKEIAECERLERRSSKEWERVGTKEEAVKMVKFKERKQRNNLIFWGVVVAANYGLVKLNARKQNEIETNNAE